MTTNSKRRRGEAPLDGIAARPGPRALIVAGQMGGAGKTTAGLVRVFAEGAGSDTAATTRKTGHRFARGWRFAR